MIAINSKCTLFSKLAVKPTNLIMITFTSIRLTNCCFVILHSYAIVVMNSHSHITVQLVVILIKADQIDSLKKSAFCLKTSYFMNK